MKRSILVMIGLSIVLSVFAQAQRPFGSIDYAEGTVSIVRAGKSLGDAYIGDDVMPDDMVRTGADGLVIISLDRSTGMRGTLTVKARSVVYLRLQPSDSGVRSTIELVSGQIGSKLARIAGTPSLNVQTESVVMGVRGTAFDIATSVNGSVLILCTEGQVAAKDELTTYTVVAGQGVERKVGQRLRMIPVAITSPERFQQQWISDEIAAFKANAPRALADYERRYIDLMARFTAAFDPLQKSEVLSKWIREDVMGSRITPNDPAVMREKREMIGPIMDVRKILFIFERIYYRILELEGIIAGTSLERTVLRPGLTAADFLRHVKQDAPGLERRMFLFRYAERLYELRNTGGAGMFGQDADAFFDSDDDWDF
jgi:hypothetical protein